MFALTRPTHNRFAPSDVIFLHDNAPRTRQPTINNVRGAIHWLLQGVASGASLLLVFAGPALIPSDGWPTADINTGSVQGFCFADERSSLTLELRTLLQSTTLPPDCRLHAIIDTVSGVVPIDLPASAQLRPNGLPAWQVQLVSQHAVFTVEEHVHCGRTCPLWSNTHHTQGAADHEDESELEDTFDFDMVTPRPVMPAMPPPVDGEVVVLHAAKGLLVENAAEDDEDAPAVGSLCFGLTQALEQGHAQSYEGLLRAMRLALRNGPAQQLVPREIELMATIRFPLKRGFVL